VYDAMCPDSKAWGPYRGDLRPAIPLKK